MIILRDITVEDKEKLWNWRNMPEVSQYMYTDHYISAEEHETWFENAVKDIRRKYWVIRYQDEDVGLVNLYDIDKNHQRCYWAFYIANPNMRGKGIGGFVEYFALQYVFETLELNKLCCEVLVSNPAVIDLHKKFGFSQEGYYRQHIVKDMQFVDVITLALLKEEWLKKQPEVEKRLERILVRQNKQ